MEKRTTTAGSLAFDYRELLAQVHDAIVATDLNGVIQTWNAGAERIYGYSSQETLGRNMALLIFHEDAALIEDLVLKPLRAKGLHQVQLRNRRKDGSEIFVSLRISVICDNDDTVIGFVACSSDITERKQLEDELARTRAELERSLEERTREITALNSQLKHELAEGRRLASELQENQRRLKHLLLRSPGILYSCEPSGDFGATFISDNAECIFGYPAQEFLRESSFWVARIHPEDLPRVLVNAAKIVEAGYHSHDYRFLHGDGTYRHVRDSAMAVRDDSGAVIEIVGYCEDITREKEAEHARKEEEKLRFLADTLLTTQEAERKRISRELHDDLNQGLASLILDIGLLGRDLPRSTEDFQSRLHELKYRAAKISDEVRRIALQLHSASLDQFGLRAALEQECKVVSERSKIRIHFEPNSKRTVLSEDVSLSLYRVAQECLRNVIRHAQARHCIVTLDDLPHAIRLRVQDDGVGFEPGQVRVKKSLGLISMTERVRLLGGTLLVDSDKGRGTRVEARVPMLEEA